VRYFQSLGPQPLSGKPSGAHAPPRTTTPWQSLLSYRGAPGSI